MENRCPYEKAVITYFGLPEDVDERAIIHPVDFGGLCDLICHFDNQRTHSQEVQDAMKDNKIELLKEDIECVHKYLDDLKIPKTDSDNRTYSIVGRIRCLEMNYLAQLSQLETHYFDKYKRIPDEGMEKIIGDAVDAGIRYGRFMEHPFDPAWASPNKDQYIKHAIEQLK